MNMRKPFLCVIALFLAGTFLQAQNVGINTTGAVADPSAMLDVVSTTSGVLVPRMTDVQRIAIASPATGLLVYQTNGTQQGYWYFDGTIWVSLCSNSIYNNMYQAVSTAGVTVTVVGTWVALPGLTQTITLTGNAKVYIHLDAGIQNTSGVGNTTAIADVVITQNGSFLSDGGYKRVMVNNVAFGTSIENCSMDVIQTLPPGTYTFAALASKNAGQNANVSGNNGSVLRGVMDIIVVYQ
jgi:hypothetical protein